MDNGDKTPRQMPDSAEALTEFGLELGEGVKRVLSISASDRQVWQAISKAGNLTAYHPLCKSNPVDRWSGADSSDVIIYHSGLTYRRNFFRWMEGVGYDLELGPKAPFKTAKVSWRLEGITPTSCQLSIEVIPYLKADLPAEKKMAYQKRFFAESMEAYLDHVLAGINYFVTTGKTVEKNQFGELPIYSYA